MVSRTHPTLNKDTLTPKEKQRMEKNHYLIATHTEMTVMFP